MKRRGVVLIVALVFMLVLAIMAMAIVYLASSNTRSVGFQLDNVKALYLAGAGIENKLRYVRDGQLPVTQLQTITLGDGTIENTSNDYQPTLHTLSINMLGNVGSGTDLSKARVIATFMDDGSGKFSTCISWKETYEQ